MIFCTKLDVRRAKESNFLAVRHFFNIHANLVTLQEIRIYIFQKNSSLIQVLFQKYRFMKTIPDIFIET